MPLENDISWTNARGSQADNPPFFNTAFTSHTSEKWIDTLRGRMGYAWDRVLFYGTGGAAFAGTEMNYPTQALRALGGVSEPHGPGRGSRPKSFSPSKSIERAEA